MAAAGDVAAGARIHFRHFASGEELSVLDRHDAETVTALPISPDAGLNIVHGIHDIDRTVIADLALRSLG